MTTSKTFNLDAKAIKKAMKSYGIKVKRCAKGAGSQKKAALIVVCASSLEDTIRFFAEFGIVNFRGKTHRTPSTSYGYADFGACYMSESMYLELKEA